MLLTSSALSKSSEVDLAIGMCAPIFKVNKKVFNKSRYSVKFMHSAVVVFCDIIHSMCMVTTELVHYSDLSVV